MSGFSLSYCEQLLWRELQCNSHIPHNLDNLCGIIEEDREKDRKKRAAYNRRLKIVSDFLPPHTYTQTAAGGCIPIVIIIVDCIFSIVYSLFDANTVYTVKFFFFPHLCCTQTGRFQIHNDKHTYTNTLKVERKKEQKLQNVTIQCKT